MAWRSRRPLRGLSSPCTDAVLGPAWAGLVAVCFLAIIVLSVRYVPRKET